MNKADYTSLINTKLPDGGNIPSSQHRETMHTDPNSIIELVYGDSIVELTSGTLAITSTTNSEYVLYFNRVGRRIFVNGYIEAIDTITANTTLVTITDTDWISQSNNFVGKAYQSNYTPNEIKIYINGNSIKSQSTIMAGERFNIMEFSYNSQN